MRAVLPFKLLPLYTGPNAYALHEALQEAVAHTHALHGALQDTSQLLSG